MQLKIQKTSKFAFFAFAMGCILVSSGCRNSSTSAIPQNTTKPVVAVTPTPTQTPTTPGNANGQTTIKENPTSATQISNIPNGTLKLRFSSGGVVHEGTLTINENSGKLLTTFFDVNSNQTTNVQQIIKVENTSKGLALFGYNPVYPDTQTPYPNYSPDNFLLGINPDGSINLRTCDDADNCSDVEIIDS